MRNLLFKCPECATGLAFDRKLAGRELSCPACKARIAVPVPDASFNCPTCGAELHVASDASGEFECPACKGPIAIEGETRPQPKRQPAPPPPVAGKAAPGSSSAPSPARDGRPQKDIQIRRATAAEVERDRRARARLWACVAGAAVLVVALTAFAVAAANRHAIDREYRDALSVAQDESTPDAGIAALRSVLSRYPDARLAQQAKDRINQVIESAYASAFKRADEAATPEDAVREVEAVLAQYPGCTMVPAANSKIAAIRAAKKRQDDALDTAIVDAEVLISGGWFDPAETRLTKALKENPHASRLADATNMLGQAKTGAARQRRTAAADDYRKRAKNTKPEEMVDSVRKCAELGIPEAQRDLAVLYANGRGVPRDDVECAKWARRAAEQGNADAQAQLGALLYAGGDGVPKDWVQAARWFQEAAEQDDARSQYILASMLSTGGNGLEKDAVAALRWCREAAEKGFVEAQVSLGVMCYQGDEVQRDAAEAVKWLRKAADAGSSRAALYLARVFRSGGPGLQSDLKQAASWCRKAAEQGDVQAQYDMGISCAQGEGVAKDLPASARWFRLSAEQGNADAQYNMGVYCQSGLGVAQDPVAALKWYRAAAAQGQQNAKQALAGMGIDPSPGKSAEVVGSVSNEEQDPKSRALLEQGLASEQRGDSAQAVRFFRQAAERGSAWGQNNLGINYLQGDGVPKDAAEGVRWLRKAAAQGLREAQAALGTCYVQGSGIEKDLAEGARWYTKAAEQGDAVAQRQLSLMYGFGMGVPKSNAEAVRWAREAASRGDAQAKEWIAKWDASQGTGAPPDATPSMGHRNPWGKAGERVVGTYPTFDAAYRAKQGLRGLVTANLDALSEEVVNAGTASMTVQRPPEYRIEADHERGVWLLIEQRF